jgi:carboxymethylenebutenolidase
VLVVHENRGLNPHIEDIARRLALDGSWRWPQMR